MAQTEDFVYIKYTRGDYHQIHLVVHHPWEFKPYIKLPRREVLEYGLGYFNMFREDFQFVSEEEYEAWVAAEAEKAAMVRYCGDFGGENKLGNFCAKRVDGEGCRCEHHGGNEPELQGSYPATPDRRPENLR